MNTFLCVILKDTISLWRVNQNKTTNNPDFKQVRKINASPIPQGNSSHRHNLIFLKSIMSVLSFRINISESDFVKISKI